jgi:hypothetical protein
MKNKPLKKEITRGGYPTSMSTKNDQAKKMDFKPQITKIGLDKKEETKLNSNSDKKYRISDLNQTQKL